MVDERYHDSPARHRRADHGDLVARQARAPLVGVQPALVAGARALVPDQRLVHPGAVHITPEQRVRGGVFDDHRLAIIAELRHRCSTRPRQTTHRIISQRPDPAGARQTAPADG